MSDASLSPMSSVTVLTPFARLAAASAARFSAKFPTRPANSPCRIDCRADVAGHHARLQLNCARAAYRSILWLHIEVPLKVYRLKVCEHLALAVRLDAPSRR